ncbi:MAG TPA: LysR family transcriptional regulator [Paracoccaceae bacterium]|nr:LysR family transcriptional regulator [Paracoccaceae bacterium]
MPGPDAMPPARLRIRVVFGDAAMIGPGKADLLDHIAATGSIAAAGRAMVMSYKRAWILVETLNAMFRAPLVDRLRGGPTRGGAVLTPTGRAVLDAYRLLEASAGAAAAAPLAAMTDLLCDMPGRK